MTKTYSYQKPKRVYITPKLLLRGLGFFLFIVGIGTVVYVFSPLIIWQLTLAPAFADDTVAAPVPNYSILTPETMKSLITASVESVTGGNDNDVSSWFPSYVIQQGATPRVPSYFLTIPKLGITNAYVSTTDTNLGAHLVSLSGTGLPPDKGNTVIFGHSTLPQLYQPGNYHTIFADLYKLQIGDMFETTVDSVVYTYKIFSITVVDPDNTSVLAQTYDDSYVTIITCTPPGTIWKRLIIKARLQKLS